MKTPILDIDPDTIQLLVLLVTGVLMPLVAWWIKRDVNAIAKGQVDITKSQIKVEEKVLELEHNTNAIKDALVKSTAQLSHAEGMIAGKQEAKAEQALVDKGVLAGRAAMSEPEKKIR